MLLPIGLLSLAEVTRRVGGRPVTWRHDAVVWVGVTVLGFVFVKATPAGHDAYAWAVGALRWPLHGGGVVRPIVVARDLGDLLALVVVPLPFTLIRRRARRTSRMVVRN